MLLTLDLLDRVMHAPVCVGRVIAVCATFRTVAYSIQSTKMLDAMAPWSDQSPSYNKDRLQSPERAQRRSQAGSSLILQPETPAPKAPARVNANTGKSAQPSAEVPSSAGAATEAHSAQPQASVSPPSEQLSDSTDAESSLAEERQQPAEPLLQEDEQRYTMYPIE